MSALNHAKGWNHSPPRPRLTKQSLNPRFCPSSRPSVQDWNRLPTTGTTYDTFPNPTRKLETVTEPKVLPKFSLSSLEGVRKLGMTQMEHYVGKNLEDRGGLPRVTNMVKNYMDSLRDIAIDRPPSCQEPDVPGQGTRQRDQSLKQEHQGCRHMREITYRMFDSPYNTCNSCHHDLPPQTVEYTEMDEVPFTAYQDTTVRPGYQDTMMVSATLPTEGLVLMEPDREKQPPLLAMPYAISNMTSRYKNADLKKDTLDSKRRHMKVGKYLVYNTGEDLIFIKKGETVGHCTLIYQDSMDDYLNEMGHMAKEARADKVEWKRKRTRCRKDEPQKITETQPLSDEWVKEAFKLSDNKVLKDKPEVMGQLVKVLAKHGPAFKGGPHRAQETIQQGAGRTHWIMARVELKDDSKGPTHVKQRRMHPHDEDLLSSQLALWIEQGVIEPCESQWNSALLSVSKKDSTLKRFCIDLRPLNKQCKKLSVFQGSIETNLDWLHGSVLYSAFNMSSGFMAVPLEASSKQYFAFTMPKQGTYAFSVLLFGWVNSPAFYARFINRLVSTMPVGSTLAYVDDILLHSKEASGIHMVQLIDQFLARVEQSGAKIQVAKTALMKDQVNYLGFIVGKAGITMNRQYCSALLDFPPPTSGKGLARFQGMVGFYRQFLPGLSEILTRLHTKKYENPWTRMSDEDLMDFYKIKDKLINSEALASPDFSDLDKYPLIMGLDFSIQAMCVTISQIQKCLDGLLRRRLLFCMGRKCSTSGQNWSSHHGESATFIWGLTTYAWLLKRAPFLVETDSMSVKYIDNMKSSRGVHARWAELISSYCVSRCPSHLPEPTQEELDIEKDWEADPPPNLDLEKLVNKAAQLQVRPERICQIHEDAIQMNLVFNNGKVEMGWERPEEDERHQPERDKQLETMISELHQETKEEPGIWVHDWNWTQTAERPTAQRDHAYDSEIFYLDDERETEDAKVAYSYDEKHLGAVNEEEKDEPKPRFEPRRSGRLWAPTQ